MVFIPFVPSYYREQALYTRASTLVPKTIYTGSTIVLYMAQTYHVNLARVPRFAHEMILAQIARDEGIAIEDIIVEGVI